MTLDEMIDGILKREGGYVNHPSDPGGATNYGITQRVARANGFTGHMRDLPLSTAREIYRREYIVKPKFHLIADVDMAVAEEVIDSGVNAGQSRAAKWFQQALNIFNNDGKDYPDIVEDGAIGPRTIAAFEGLRRKRGSHVARRVMLKALDGLQFMHYYSLAKADVKFEAFMVGWVDHRIGNVDAL